MGAKRSPNEARGKKKAVKPIVNLNLGIDLELDFDAEDFDLLEGGEKKRPTGEKQRNVRILRPALEKKELTTRAAYENAEAFARQIDLSPGARTFAWVSGNFIFGDVIEALVTARRVGIRRLYICSLSISQENIDSLKNVMLLMGDELERLVLVFSGYQYSHEKYNLVPYMYSELDDPMNRVQIAFGRWHAKLITMETVTGRTITIHGSANLRSSNSVEQIMVEVDNQALHDFNASIMEDIARRFGTINTGAEYTKLKPIEAREAWEIFAGEDRTSWHQDQQGAGDAQGAPPSGATPPPEAGA